MKPVEPDDTDSKVKGKSVPELMKGYKTKASPEPDDAQVKPSRPRDVPSGKFADKRKGINMGDIK